MRKRRLEYSGHLIGWKKVTISKTDREGVAQRTDFLIQLLIPGDATVGGLNHPCRKYMGHRYIIKKANSLSDHANMTVKRRTNKALVIDILRMPSDSQTESISVSPSLRVPRTHERKTVYYQKRHWIRPATPFSKTRVECESGIHFFLSREAAENY